MKMTTIKNILISLVLLLITSTCLAQSNIYLEIAGTGGLGSINYEKVFKPEKDLSYSLRTGFSIAPIDKNNGVALIFPVMFNGIYGQNKHKLEFGLGQSFTLSTKGSFFIMGVSNLGYRLEPDDKNYFFRLSYTPIISYLIDFQWQHWAGISIGYKL
ncbi:MAG: hypothetical protein JXR36_03160 [Bacteroidales bacterium]|nr:hypothetical protein [Bacteroidales bacterium]